jgi:hypothetical protein
MAARGLPYLCVAGLLCCMLSCTAVRQVVPLEPGENAVNVSLGGPMTNYVGDAYLPLPFIGISYNRGILKWLDAEAGLDVTHMLYKNLSLSLGANFRPIGARRWRPALIVSPKAHLATNFDTYFRFYPVLGLTGAWNPREGSWYPYVGVENWWELVNDREDGTQQQEHWFFAPYLGLVYNKTRWQYQIEMRVYSPNLDNDYGRAPANWGFGDHGIIGFFLGIGRSFGGARTDPAAE